MSNRVLFAIVLLLVSGELSGDTVADLKQSLAALTGTSPLHAHVDWTRRRHSHGRLMNDDFDGSASVDVAVDAGRTQLSFSRPMLDRAAAQRPAAMALGEITGPQIETNIDFASTLLKLVARGHVTNDHPLLYEGRRARVIEMHLAPVPSETDEASKTTDDILTIWVTDPGALPIAATRVRRGSVGVLLMHVDTVRTESWRFTRFGDHLVALRSEDRSVITGSIQHGEASSVCTVDRLDP